MRKNPKLKNQIAIVTGAASGIGRATAIRFAKEGAKVACVDIDLEGAKKVVKEIKSSGGEAAALEADVRDPKQVSKAVHRVIETWGQINILVNNAGITRHASILDDDVVGKWIEVVDTNLTGAFLMTEAVAKLMVENGWQGSVINITSVHSQVPVANGAYYPAAKAGLAAATKSWALELAKHGIRVNAVAPGAIMNTGMNKAVTPGDDEPKAKELRIPLGRHGKPEEVAKATISLATNSYITGHELVVDGGFSLTH